MHKFEYNQKAGMIHDATMTLDGMEIHPHRVDLCLEAGELPKLIIEFTPGEFVFEGVLSPKKHGE